MLFSFDVVEDIQQHLDWCCSVKLCLTLCNPMNCSTPGSPVLHYLLEFAQIHVCWVGDANYLILCCPLLLSFLVSRSFPWVGSSYKVCQLCWSSPASKNQTYVLLISSVGFLFSVSLISTLIFIISFLLLALGLVYSFIFFFLLLSEVDD